ncbi:MAG: Mov34/MPN/PAD-1 family protein [Deltaproteobacteria bacterium]|nr:Mov34/MPN/PAD-1 family protein [Deltaproteobacteria bacterium]
MRVFGLELDRAHLVAIAEHAEHAYPREACGLVVGRPDRSELVRVVPMSNVQDRHHQRDPVRFPLSAREAFRFDALEHLRVLEQIEAEGLVERVLYHSHADQGAYLSDADRAMAVPEGIELLPGVAHLVVSVREGVRSDAAVFRFAKERGVFEEVRLPLERW